MHWLQPVSELPPFWALNHWSKEISHDLLSFGTPTLHKYTKKNLYCWRCCSKIVVFFACIWILFCFRFICLHETYKKNTVAPYSHFAVTFQIENGCWHCRSRKESRPLYLLIFQPQILCLSLPTLGFGDEEDKAQCSVNNPKCRLVLFLK